MKLCYLHMVLYLFAFFGALLILISFCEISSYMDSRYSRGKSLLSFIPLFIVMYCSLVIFLFTCRNEKRLIQVLKSYLNKKKEEVSYSFKILKCLLINGTAEDTSSEKFFI